MIVVSDPDEFRKAADFVEALADVEERFGFCLGVGRAEDAGSDYFEPVTFGPDGAYTVVRAPHGEETPGSLALALGDVT